MAKHCNVCTQTYSDDLDYCPRCGKAPAARSLTAIKDDPATRSAPGSEVDLHLADTPRAISETHADIDLRRQSEPAQPAGAGPAEGASAVNLGGALSAILPSPSGEIPPPSGLGLVTEALDDEFSGVLVRGTSDDPESVRSVPSGLEQTPPLLPKSSDSDFAPDDEEASHWESSSVDLGAPAPAGERPFARDPIAEEVESGVSLRRQSEAAGVPEERVLDHSRIVLASDSDDVDLTAPGPLVDSPSNPFVAKRDQTPTDLHLGKFVASSAEALPEEEESLPPSSQSEAAAAAGRSKLARAGLVGGAIGVVVGTAACLLLWILGIEPPSGLRLSRSTPPPSAEQNLKQVPQTPLIVGPTLGDALADVTRGDLDKAMALLEAPGDEPERLAARGEARWLTYLNRQQQKNLPLSADDAEVKLAIQDLANANTPHALVWLDSIKEQLGNWQFRAMLQDAGYPVAPKQTAVAALNAALRDAKSKAGIEALQGKYDQLTKDLDIQRRKYAEQMAATKQAEQNAKDLSDTAKAAQVQAKAAEEKLTEAQTRLATEIAELAAARADAETKLAAAEKQHPALTRPDSLRGSNVLAAQEHYSAGLRLYSDHMYDKAEQEFHAAVQSDAQDARYFYYLGLSRLLLDKRNAALADFEQAAKLETQGRPDRATVSEALERVQGMPRQEINRFRP